MTLADHIRAINPNFGAPRVQQWSIGVQRQLTYGNSDFDVRHRISASYGYQLPFGNGKAMLPSGPASWVLGNWTTSRVYTLYSGHPFQAAWSSESSLLDPYGFAMAPPHQVALHI